MNLYRILCLFWIALVAQSYANETINPPASAMVDLPPFTITGQRQFDATNTTSNKLYAYQILDAAELKEHAAFNIDTLLDDSPAFSLFRRSNSAVAHPTTQGISLRNLAPTATSRSLVLLDGVPQNDPFGSWVYWSRYTPAALSAISLKTAAQSEAWGNLGAGGSVRLTRRDPFDEHAEVSATVGSYSTSVFSTSFSKSIHENIALSLQAHHFNTDGYPVIDEAFRGIIDEDAHSQNRSIDLGLAWQATEQWKVNTHVAWFDEQRGNGTPQAHNRTEALDVSLEVAGELSGIEGELTWTTYFQDRDFYNQFTAIAADRASERPALEQFDVPGSAWGSALTLYGQMGERFDWLAGVDGRILKGETNESFRNLGAGFTRQRNAGGEQAFLGSFVGFNYQISETLSFEATLRGDSWTLQDGVRNEFDTTTNTPTNLNTFADRTEAFIGGNIGMRYQWDSTASLALRAVRGFRAPTINELYRPFRVGNDITEANPNLDHETLHGGEIEWNQQLHSTTQFKILGYYYDWRDVVANVPLSQGGGGFSPVCGFVPGGGSCSQRLNVEHASSYGLEPTLEYAPTSNFEMKLSYLLSQSRIHESSQQPQLESKQFAQSPTHRFISEVIWSPLQPVQLSAQLEYWDSQYEDALNQRELDDFYTAAFGFDYTYSPNLSLGVLLENAFSKTIQTGIRSDGTPTIGIPRTLWLSFRYAF